MSSYPEAYLLARYFRRRSTEPVCFVMSVAAATKTLQEKLYQNLAGTLLEGLGAAGGEREALCIADAAPDVPVGSGEYFGNADDTGFRQPSGNSG